MSDKDTIYRQDAIDAINAYLGLSAVSRTIQNMTSIQEILEKLPSAQLERHYCRECKWSRCHINLDKYGRSETYWHCLNWDGGTDEEGFCHEWERRADG